MNCKNCGQKAGGNFCQDCGQSTKVGKVNVSNFFGELSSSVFQVDKGFLFTLKELFVRPGHSIREYLEGKRKNHFKPIAYAFTLSTIYFLLSRITENDTFLNDVIAGWSIDADGSETEAKQLAVLNWFARNYAYTMLMLIPLFSLASYLAFLKLRFNYLEHFVLSAYITGQQAIFYSIFAVLGFFIEQEDTFSSITLIVSISYAFLVFLQFFYMQSRLRVFFRLVLTYVLYLIIPALALFMIFIVLGR